MSELRGTPLKYYRYARLARRVTRLRTPRSRAAFLLSLLTHPGQIGSWVAEFGFAPLLAGGLLAAGWGSFFYLLIQGNIEYQDWLKREIRRKMGEEFRSQFNQLVQQNKLDEAASLRLKYMSNLGST